MYYSHLVRFRIVSSTGSYIRIYAETQKGYSCDFIMIVRCTALFRKGLFCVVYSFSTRVILFLIVRYAALSRKGFFCVVYSFLTTSWVVGSLDGKDGRGYSAIDYP